MTTKMSWSATGVLKGVLKCIKRRRGSVNDDVRACKGDKEALKGDEDALNGDKKTLKSDEETLKGNGEG